MNKYDMYVTFIFLIKIGFILMAISHIYLKSKGEEKSDLDKKVLYWKERFEFIFIAAMSILLIYLFNPRKDKNMLIDKETKVLLFLFGFILLITAKWGIFFKESHLFVRIQKSIGST
jgi:hypothetical protein